MTSNRDILHSARKPYNSGGTNAQKAVNAALDMLENARPLQNRVIILLSDGDVNVDYTTISRAKSSFVRIYCVGLGSDANSSKLKRIAEETHGNHYIAATSDELAAIYNDISLDQFLKTDWEDNDEDGIPDDFEASGLICSNGKIYYTRYMNKEIGYDSDGDGLSDGQEILIRFKKKYNFIGPTIDPDPGAIYFQMVSNPLSADSDYDGIADGWVDVYGTQQTNDGEPMIKSPYQVPYYVWKSIEFSGLSKLNDKFEKDDNLDTLLVGVNPALQEKDCSYSTLIKKDPYIFGIGKYLCNFYIAYYDKENADRVLKELTMSKQVADNILSFLDGISNPLGDPNIVGEPEKVSFGVALYSVFRSLGVINPDTQPDLKAEKKLGLFIDLYGVEHGKTPICVVASIIKISSKDGGVSVFKSYQDWP